MRRDNLLAHSLVRRQGLGLGLGLNIRTPTYRNDTNPNRKPDQDDGPVQSSFLHSLGLQFCALYHKPECQSIELSARSTLLGNTLSDPSCPLQPPPSLPECPRTLESPHTLPQHQPIPSLSHHTNSQYITEFLFPIRSYPEIYGCRRTTDDDPAVKS